MEDEQQPVDPQQNGASEEVEEKDPPPPVPAVIKPLTTDQVASSLSVLSRTGNGLAHAYIKLELHNVALTSLEVLDQYPHLRYVDLSENQIRDIASLSTLEHLLSLNMSNNYLSAVPVELDNRKYLQLANFSKNYISEFNVSKWDMLVALNLNNNRLPNLTMSFFPELSILEARENKLTEIPKGSMSKLKQLYLTGNKITKVSNMEKLDHLETLYLRQNRLTTLDGFSEANVNLQHLNIRQNKIATFAEFDKLKCLTGLRSITSKENPVCDLDGYRAEILSRLPFLNKIDKEPVTEEEREEAKIMAAERAAAKAQPIDPNAGQATEEAPQEVTDN